MASIKQNFFYRLILTSASYIFPLLVFPYATRVLGVENIGLCNFIDSLIAQFVVFSMMGINVMGIREVAAAAHDRKSLDTVFSSLIAMHSIFTFVMLAILIVCTLMIKELWENRLLMCFGAIRLISSVFMIEWFFSGLEKFKYITKRTILVKSLYVVAVFLFVRSSSDYPVYFLLTSCLIFAVNGIINIVYSRKFVTFSFRNIKFRPFIKHYISLGIFTVLINIYTSFTTTFLGFATDDIQVGYYSTAFRIFLILQYIFDALISVLLPRSSALLQQGDHERFIYLIKKSFRLLFSVIIPIILITVIFAPQMIRFIAGKGYEGAILPLRILMPLTLLIGSSKILEVQTLMPLKKDTWMAWISTAGACVSLILNFILVPRLEAVGSALVCVCCETVIVILSQIAVTRSIGLRYPYATMLRYALPWLVMIPVLVAIYIYVHDWFLSLLCGGVATLLGFIIIQRFIIRDDTILSLLIKFMPRRGNPKLN